MEQKFRVVRIDNGADNPHTGIVSYHDTAEEAYGAIRKANYRLRLHAGYQTARHPYAVQQASTVTYSDGSTETVWG